MLGDGSRGHRARGSPGAATGPSGGSWSHGARGSLGAVLCPGTGAGATGHVAVPELSWALVAGAGVTWRSRSCPVPGNGSRRRRAHVRPSFLSSLT
jgi:hypothetical protein